ncbi:ABC1 kinase family protein [Microbacterium rhizomatis]|uniref:AarF/ABC1/UbiB kinase family protein n=1 Tax=Microbacterium rhizomatis TaxID=1631477 RepID=A0A5J5J1K8_9MICO|nr:AarF/UbiB family protein [Microbacterium rhizomatis]KAA9108247.1 AarF/ABC1/UbiB kinase family protein [Microbacterium rhizomatis]
MPTWLVISIVAVVFALLAAWVVRRLLDTQIGWIRAGVTALVVFVLALPIADWSLQQADVIVDGRIVVDDLIAVSFLALTFGWMFAAVVICIITLEFLWPSQGFRNPITTVRDLIRRRDRARRYAQILAIGSRHGLGLYESRRKGATDDLPAALVGAMNDAGVTFVKLGQVLSTRDDVLPPDILAAFATLQMDSTPIAWAEAEAAITAQLGRPIAEVFGEIDPVPLAAASVAQVHAARLVSGEDVVVKIQRPSARAQVTTDLDILGRLAGEAERRTTWAREYGATALAAEFSRALREELDYRSEARNTEMLRAAIEKAPSVLRVPRVYVEFSTEQMLVQERATGTPFSRLDGSALDPDLGAALADSVLAAVFDQIAVRGVFHADLHPGNLILSDPADGAATVTLIDFGAVGIIEKSMRRMLVPLLIAIMNEDDVAATDLALLMCGESPSLDKVALQRDIGVILTRMTYSGSHQDIFALFLDALRRHRMALPPSLLLVFRTLGSLEGTLRKLSPRYDMVGAALELAPKVAFGAVSGRSAMLGAQTWAAVLTEQFRRMPRRIESVTRSLEQGDLSVRLRTFESTDERSWIDSLLGRMTTTLVGIALVITGILLTVNGAGPMLTTNVSVYEFLGSIVGLGGLLLLLRSLRTSFRRRSSSR